MLIKTMSMQILISVVSLFADITINLSGMVTNNQGTALPNAIVLLEKSSLITESNTSGNYSFNTTIGIKQPVSSRCTSPFQYKNGFLSLNHSASGSWDIRAFNLNGKMLWFKNGNMVNDNSDIRLPSVPSVLLYVLSLNRNEYVFRANAFNNSFSILSHSLRSSSESLSGTKISLDTIRVSKAGYTSKRIPVESFSGTLNIMLDPLVSDSVGKSGFTDGSIDRITKYGQAQYFWGMLGGVDQPLVKIVHAISADVVDIEVIFSPYFVDNTYGTGSIGWGKRGHTFKDLYSSDHVALALSNAAGDTVFAGKLDLISATSKVKSGYACLGPFGGDGIMTKGKASDIVSFGNSLDDNLNYFGYNLQTNSPATDSTYKINPQYPNWQYYVVYRLSIKSSAFGSSSYGKALMTSVHASPSKDESSTIIVTEKEPPIPGTPTDVFRYILPPVIKPPVNDTIDVD